MSVEYLMNGYPGIRDRHTAECLDVLRDLWPNHDGPAHIVLADFNLEDHFIRSCMEGCDKGDLSANEEHHPGHPIYAATKAVLDSMLLTPEDIRLQMDD